MSALRRATAGLLPEAIKGLRWRLFDAKGQVLGRLASQIAVVLQGKDKPTYTPHKEEGDICVVVNARHVALTGDKVKTKVYYWHTGYIGGIKKRTVAEEMRRDPTEVLRTAVHRMLPRNRLRDDRMRKLRIFADDGDPALSEQPLEVFVPPPRTVRAMLPRQRRAALRAGQKPPPPAPLSQQ